MAKHGGKREGAGRPKTTFEGGAEFADSILRRIGELKRKNVKTAEDYALQLLGAQDVRVNKETFLSLLLMKFGRPPQSVQAGGTDGVTLEIVVRNIGSLSKPG